MKALARDTPPLVAFLDITYRCNLRCRMCNVWRIAKQVRELDIEEWKNIVLQLIQAFSVRDFKIVGGEPFCSPHFRSLVHYIKARGCRLAITSNGTLINREMAHFLVSEGVDRIVVSINGLQKIDDFYRGKGTFTKSMKSIQALVEEKELQSVHIPRIEIHPFVSRVNCREIVKLRGIARELKEDFHFHFLESTQNDGFSRGVDPGFPEKPQKRSIMSTKERRDFEERFSNLLSFREWFLHALFSRIRKLKIWRDCPLAAYHILIDPWGRTFPCARLYDYPYGDCRENHIKAVWESRKRAVLRHHIRKGSFRTCQVCGKRRFMPPAFLMPQPLALRIHEIAWRRYR